MLVDTSRSMTVASSDTLFRGQRSPAGSEVLGGTTRSTSSRGPLETTSSTRPAQPTSSNGAEQQVSGGARRHHGGAGAGSELFLVATQMQEFIKRRFD